MTIQRRTVVRLEHVTTTSHHIAASTGLRRNHVRHSRFSHTTKICAALKIDEYVPLKMPTSSTTMKCRIVTPPNNASASKVKNTVSWVLIDRSSVWITL